MQKEMKKGSGNTTDVSLNKKAEGTKEAKTKIKNLPYKKKDSTELNRKQKQLEGSQVKIRFTVHY